MKLAFLIVKRKLRNNESKSVSNGGGVSEFIFGDTFKWMLRLSVHNICLRNHRHYWFWSDLEVLCNWIPVFGYIGHSHFIYLRSYGLHSSVSYSFWNLWKALLTFSLKRNLKSLWVISNWSRVVKFQRVIVLAMSNRCRAESSSDFKPLNCNRLGSIPITCLDGNKFRRQLMENRGLRNKFIKTFDASTWLHDLTLQQGL